MWLSLCILTFPILMKKGYYKCFMPLFYAGHDCWFYKHNSDILFLPPASYENSFWPPAWNLTLIIKLRFHRDKMTWLFACTQPNLNITLLLSIECDCKSRFERSVWWDANLIFHCYIVNPPVYSPAVKSQRNYSLLFSFKLFPSGLVHCRHFCVCTPQGKCNQYILGNLGGVTWYGIWQH